MKWIIAAALAAVTSSLGQDWRSAMPGWHYEFPHDHHTHPEFRTEWWYFTGNLFDENGKRFGYELTFFREGIIPMMERVEERSRFVVNELKFAHFTITDVSGRKFRFDQKASRGAFDDAGFDRASVLVWIDDWSVQLNSAGDFQLMAASADAALDLTLAPQKPPIIHGENGVSLKATGEDHASHYYSATKLGSHGTIKLNGREIRVSGASWFDHEWASNRLAPHQVGWNWLCVQFTNDTELMLYQMRRDDGTIDPASSGTFVAADGSAAHLAARDFLMTSSAVWKSERTGVTYPVEWQIEIPSRQLRFKVRPVLNEQELALLPLIYWEGAVDISGSDRNATGVGYLELTGYAGPLVETLNR